MLTKKILRPAWNRSFGRLDGQYIRELNRIVDSSCASLLDVGCGFNSPVQHLCHRPACMVGIDGFLPAIDQSRAKRIHDEYHEMSLRDIDRVFGPESFDCILASDVIEHFPEEDALDLISQMEKVARRKIIIFTPNGFLPQGEEYGNPFQRHLSGWTVKQMETMGYRVIGIEGIKSLRGEMARIRWHPEHFWLMISLLSQAVVRDHPAHAFRLLCFKEKRL
jgi:2-polyprenyl-3-methyl-5-hydroxy-6-metoxy-1,4-benzoquinol methylase